MDLDAFRKALSVHLVPLLRREGFKGSAATYRRVAAPVVHVFNIQGSAGSDRCYLNLGVQLDFLQSNASRPLAKVLEYDCTFRQRLHGAAPTTGWHYGGSPDECDANARAAAAAWQDQGRAWLSGLSRWPEDFAALVAAFDPTSGPPAHGRAMATIANRLGDTARARTIAEAALAHASERASLLRSDLQQILADLPPA